MGILKGGLLGVGLHWLVWSIGVSLVCLGWFGLLGLVLSIWAGLVDKHMNKHVNTNMHAWEHGAQYKLSSLKL